MRDLARVLTRIEKGDVGDLFERAPAAERAHVVGVTGPPGSGKSTLVDKIIDQVRSSGRNIAVLAVDPSSPLTGGAILGDRIRMTRHAGDPGVFIRSLAARGAPGGLSVAARDAVRVLDARGFDVIVLETIGVGQNELSIAGAADTVLVLVVPGQGDTVQMLKAGVLEIADILVVNKADLPSSSATVGELRAMLSMGQRPGDWEIPVTETVATEAKGVEELWRSASKHYQHLQTSGELEVRRRRRAETQLAEVLQQRLEQMLCAEIEADERLRSLRESTRLRQLDPHRAAEQILALWRSQIPGEKVPRAKSRSRQ